MHTYQDPLFTGLLSRMRWAKKLQAVVFVSHSSRMPAVLILKHRQGILFLAIHQQQQ